MQMHLGLPSNHHCGPEQRRLVPVQLKSSLRDALIATGILQTRCRRPKVASPTEDKGVLIVWSAFDLIENRPEDPCSEGVI
jgi:hypothetical protein